MVTPVPDGNDRLRKGKCVSEIVIISCLICWARSRNLSKIIPVLQRQNVQVGNFKFRFQKFIRGLVRGLVEVDISGGEYGSGGGYGNDRKKG